MTREALRELRVGQEVRFAVEEGGEYRPAYVIQVLEGGVMAIDPPHDAVSFGFIFYIPAALLYQPEPPKAKPGVWYRRTDQWGTDVFRVGMPDGRLSGYVAPSSLIVCPFDPTVWEEFEEEA